MHHGEFAPDVIMPSATNERADHQLVVGVPAVTEDPGYTPAIVSGGIRPVLPGFDGRGVDFAFA